MKPVLSAILVFLAAAAPGAAQQGSGSQAADEAAVRAVASSFVDTWNRHDMQAFAAVFADDADFVNVIGLWWQGRAEIQREHEALHATRMKNSYLAANETAVRFLRPDVAVVHVRWELVGDTGLEGEPLPPRKGILTQVLAKQGDRWLITSAQNTDILPLPNVPTAK